MANSQRLKVLISLSDSQSDTELLDKLFDLEIELAERVKEAGWGELDGNDIGEGFFTWYFFAPDIDRMFNELLPTLIAIPLPRGSYGIKRYGPDGAKEEVIHF